MSAAQQHIEAFLEMLGVERGAAANTIEAYRRDLDDFSRFLERRGMLLTDAQPADISGYLMTASESGLSPASRARRLSAIRQLYKFLLASSHVAADPAAGHSGPRKRRPLPMTLSV